MTDTSLAALLAVAEPVGHAFRDAGYRAYLVGGIVRDHLLGRSIDDAADLDLTTDATPAVIKAVVEPLADAVWTQGERFGTIGCRIDGRLYEVTTHRAERYDASSRKPEVDFSDDVEDDLSRRDFTINAMARSLPDGDLVDPFDGRGDLDRRRLMTPLDPELSFTDDPLRMLRAARFAASYGFVPDPQVVVAIRRLVGRLDIVSAERIRGELVRLLGATDPTPGLELLLGTGLAEHFLPELGTADLVAVHAVGPDPVMRMAVILGDPVESGLARLRALRFANDDLATVRRVRRGLHQLTGTEDESLRRFVVAAGPDLDRAIHLAVATAHPAAGNLGARISELVEREGDDGFAPALSGGELIAELGLEPGPVVGEAVNWLGEERLRRGPLPRDVALEAVRGWLAQR